MSVRSYQFDEEHGSIQDTDRENIVTMCDSIASYRSLDLTSKTHKEKVVHP